MTYEDVDFDAVERRAGELVEDHRELLRSLVAMRTKHALTQAEVAARMGVSQPTVASFERYDANPTLATIRRYALAVEAMIESRVTCQCVETPGWESLAESVLAGAAPPMVTPAARVAVGTHAQWTGFTLDHAMTPNHG